MEINKKIAGLLIPFLLGTSLFVTPVQGATDVKNDDTLATNLVSYWELEEQSSTRVDSHGSNDLTDNNTVLYGTGKQGNGADFEKGTSEYLSITDASQTGLDFSNVMSISAWIKLESNNTIHTIGAKYAGAHTGFIFFVNSNTSLNININGVGANGNATFNTGTWYHVVFTYDAGTAKFYVNGSDVTTDGATAVTIPDGVAPYQIGAFDGASFPFDGIIDEYGTWSKVLTAGEVAELYASGNSIPYDAGGGALPSFIKPPVVFE